MYPWKTVDRFVLNYAGVDHSQPSAVWDSRLVGWHDWDLWLVLRGRGQLRFRRDVHELHAGACLVLRPWEAYVFRSDARHPTSVMFAHYDCADRSGKLIAPAARCAPPFVRHVGELPFLEDLFERAIDLWQRSDRRRGAPNVWFDALMCELTEQERRSVGGPPSRQAGEIERICQEIAEYPGKAYTVAGLAGRLHCTADHFTRLFRRHAGYTPAAFLVRTRIEAAKRLLRATGEPVGRIGELLGFCDSYHFSKTFKQKTGITPTAFRRAHSAGPD
jgi:AraC-like DNA-binding protein